MPQAKLKSVLSLLVLLMDSFICGSGIDNLGPVARESKEAPGKLMSVS